MQCVIKMKMLKMQKWHQCHVCIIAFKTSVGAMNMVTVVGFYFPKKLIRHTVPAVMQVNAEQMEAHILLKRTCDRVPNLNKLFLKFWKQITI